MRAAAAGMGGGGSGAAAPRPGRPADVPALARIHRLARDAVLREPWRRAAVAAWLRDTLPAGSPVACPGPDGAEVLHPRVAPGFQGRGIGRSLLAEAIAAAPGGLALHAFERNRAARRFYERHGCRAAERRPASANEEGEPDRRHVLAPMPSRI